MNIDLSKYPLFSDHQQGSLTLLSDQGFSNKNYTFQYRNKPYLLRKFILQDRDREAEYKIQSLAYEEGIAAKPYLLDIECDLMICEFLEGGHRTILSREALKKIVSVLKKLHTIQIDNDMIALEDLFTFKHQDVKEAFERLEDFSKEMVLCHNDLNSKNILFSSDSVKFIDWEFAGINDLYFDLACISVEFDLSILDEAYFLTNYFLRDEYNKEKLDAYKTIYIALCKQWFEALETTQL